MGTRRPSLPGSVSLPTRRRDWRLVARTVRLVLSVPTYAAVAVLAALGGLSAFVLPRNPAVVLDVVLLGSLPLGNRLTVLLNLYPVVGAAYTPVQSAVLLLTAALVGVDVALVAYHVREHDLSGPEEPGAAEAGGGPGEADRGAGPGAGSGGALGVVLGALGAGCAACGSAALAGVLSLVGAGGLVTALPLDGLEFSALAVVVLVLSVYWVAEGLRGGRVDGCPVEV